jgi:hypothetical protein
VNANGSRKVANGSRKDAKDAKSKCGSGLFAGELRE